MCCIKLVPHALPCDWSQLGPFQRHVCDQKKWKISLLNGYSSWCKHAINKFLINNSASCSSQDIHVFEIKFFVKVKNKVHVTIGHVCDFAWNYGPAPNDFKVKILRCVMEFCIGQYTDDGQHIYKQFHILRMKLNRQDFFWCNILFGHVCDILV